MRDDSDVEDLGEENLSAEDWARRRQDRWREYVRTGPEYPEEDQEAFRYSWIREQQGRLERLEERETLQEIALALKKIQTDIADIRFDVIGERGEPHGPEWGGNFDERLWAISESTASVGGFAVWVISLLVGIIGLLVVIAWRLD